MQTTVARQALLGIDLGTSSVKVVVLDQAGRVQAATTGAYPVENPRAGWAETDPELWWRAVVAAVREAVNSAGSLPVAAIGLSGQMHGLVATAADGTALRPAMLWSDARAVEQLTGYRALPDMVRARLANPLTPGMAGPMLAWLAQHEKQTYASMRWALQPKDWIRARLTGAFCADPSDASATLLYDVFADRWDSDVLAGLGLDVELLPPLLASSGAPAGELLSGPAAELGLPPAIPVAAGAGDTAAAALGSGLTSSSDAQLTIGTGLQIVTPTPRPTSPDRLDPVTHLYRAATDTGWYSMAAVLNGGLALDWARRLFGASWEELYGTAALPPQSDDPMFLPHLNGERTPYLDTAMRGAWVGLAPRHDRPRMLRAALEGVALAARDALQALRGRGVPLDDLRLAGGGSTDPAWRQLLADALGATLRAVDVSAASGRGAAWLGARAAGLIDERTLLSLLAAKPEPSAVPRAAAAAHYSERYELFRRRVSLLRVDEAGEQTSTPDIS